MAADCLTCDQVRLMSTITGEPEATLRVSAEAGGWVQVL